MNNCDVGKKAGTGWAMEMKAICTEEPELLMQTLTSAILGRGGWVLFRGADEGGVVNIFFEFERNACVDIYSLLTSSGVELGRSGHAQFAQLCQCTHSLQPDCGAEIASIDLEIQTYPAAKTAGSRVSNRL
ncbi:MAG: hypothetical protein ABSE55_06870 [Terracidiphilus sp.]